MIRPIWELLLIIPMPWRATIVLLLLIPTLSWLIWRGVPWVLAKLSQVILICTNFLAKLLLFIEYLLTQYIKKHNRQLPSGIYIFDDVLSGIVSLINEGTQRLENVLDNALKKRWLPRKGWYITAIIILPLIWFIRPVLGETTVGKLINGGVSWWNSLEGWALTGKWSISALSSPPEQFVRDYYSALNSSQYSAAWSSLSPKFKSNKDLMPNGYSSYTDWWETVEQVDINQVTLVSKNTNSAIVDIHLQFLMRKNKKLSSSESIRHVLMWDSPNSRWLIDATKRLS